MSRVREIDKKIEPTSFSMTNDIKDLDLNNIKIDKKSYKNILICYIGYVAPITVKLLYLIVCSANGYIEESNGKKGNSMSNHQMVPSVTPQILLQLKS